MLADPAKQIVQADRTKVTERLFIWEHKRVWDLCGEGRRVEQLFRCYPRLGQMGFKLSAQPQASCVAWRKPWLSPFPTPVFSGETPPRAGGDPLLLLARLERSRQHGTLPMQSHRRWGCQTSGHGRQFGTGASDIPENQATSGPCHGQLAHKASAFCSHQPSVLFPILPSYGFCEA